MNSDRCYENQWFVDCPLHERYTSKEIIYEENELTSFAHRITFRITEVMK